MYNHVLIAVDSSPESAAVIQKGIDLAKLTGAKVSVVHVLELPMPMVGEMALVDTYFNSEEYTKIIRDAMKKLVTDAGLPGSAVEIIAGLPSSGVVNHAEKNKVDLIVTGSHGKSGVKLLLGSVASGILHKAKCDVFVVRIKG
jgi:universal stress protein A